MEYDPQTYWNTRPDPNSARGCKPERVDFDSTFIRHHVAEASNVFELGAGVGRTFSAYRPGTQLTTLDISQLYQDQLDARAAAHGIVLQQQFLSDPLQQFPFADDQFECGVCFQVMIHQPPEIFLHSLSELLRICRKTVVNVGIHQNSPQSVAPKGTHVFAHDYIDAAARLGAVMNDLRMKDGLLYFTLCPQRWSSVPTAPKEDRFDSQSHP